MNSPSKNVLALEVAAVVVVLALLVGWGYFVKTRAAATSAKSTSTTSRTITGIAAITTDVDISGCKPTPKIAKFSRFAHVTFHNKDSTPHHIYFTQSVQFDVPAKGTKVQVFKLWDSSKPRSYNCDSTKTAGVINLMD